MPMGWARLPHNQFPLHHAEIRQHLWDHHTLIFYNFLKIYWNVYLINKIICHICANAVLWFFWWWGTSLVYGKSVSGTSVSGKSVSGKSVSKRKIGQCRNIRQW
jgi:hypothetical protein